MSANAIERAAIDRIFSEWDRPDAPGMAICVVRGGEPIYTGCFGLANLEHRVAITPATVFDLASITKQFTAFAVLMLVREGKLSLDDEIRRYLPELPECRPPVRIRHCLFHTSGLNDWVVALDLSGPFSDYCSFERASRTVSAMRDTLFPTGTDHAYSNTGYLLLAWLVKRVTGRSMPDVLHTHVFAPLRMEHARFRTVPEQVIPDAAQGYFRDDDEQPGHVRAACGVYGDGGLHASITDMSRWLQNLSRQHVGDSELFAQFFAPGRLDDGQAVRYAPGWELDRYRGLRAVRHGGMGVGFQSHIAWFPDVDLGVAILANIRPCWPWQLANEVVSHLVKTPEPVCPRPRAPLGDSDDICGRYFTATGLSVVVARDNAAYLLDTGYSRDRFAPLSTDVYQHADSGDTLAFHRDDDGRVTHFALRANDRACTRLHGPLREAEKFEHVALSPVELAEYQGRFLNAELETLYTIAAENDGLRAKHLRCYDWHLHPITSSRGRTFVDEFAQAGRWPGKVTFERCSSGSITGFRVRGAGHNLFFRKLT